MLHKSPSDEQEVEAAFTFKKQRFHPAQKGRNRNRGYFWPLTTAQPSARLLSFSVGKLAFCRPARREKGGAGTFWGYLIQNCPQLPPNSVRVLASSGFP